MFIAYRSRRYYRCIPTKVVWVSGVYCAQFGGEKMMWDPASTGLPRYVLYAVRFLSLCVSCVTWEGRRRTPTNPRFYLTLSGSWGFGGPSSPQTRWKVAAVGLFDACHPFLFPLFGCFVFVVVCHRLADRETNKYFHSFPNKNLWENKDWKGMEQVHAIWFYFQFFSTRVSFLMSLDNSPSAKEASLF